MRALTRYCSIVMVCCGVAVTMSVATGTRRPGDDPVHMVLRWARAPVGGIVQVRIVGVRETPYVYGLDSLLERRTPKGAWRATFHLAFGIGGAAPTYAPVGDPGWGVRTIGLRGDRWWQLRLPPGAPPGRYRIAKTVGPRTYYAAVRIVAP